MGDTRLTDPACRKNDHCEPWHSISWRYRPKGCSHRGDEMSRASDNDPASARDAASRRLSEIRTAVQAVSALEVTATGPEREVSVTVDAAGRVKRVHIDAAGSDQVDRDEIERLSRLVAQTGRRAQARAAKVVAERSVTAPDAPTPNAKTE